MKKFEVNPMTEFIDFHGKRMRLNKLLKNEAEALAYDYLEKYGTRPPQHLIVSWMRRLKRAYHKGEVTYAVSN